MVKRKLINMDGSYHGPSGLLHHNHGPFLPHHNTPDCEIDDPVEYPGSQFYCGAPCNCGGIIHWQPIYGGYFFMCDGCESEGISHEDLEKNRLAGGL